MQGDGNRNAGPGGIVVLFLDTPVGSRLWLELP